MDASVILRFLRLGVAPALVTAGVALAQAPDSIELAQTITLEGVRGRIDHLDIDAGGARLFVAALGNDTVELVDLSTGKRSATLRSLEEPQGVAYAARTGRLFVANGRGGRLAVYSGNPLRPVGEIKGLEDADNVRYDGAADKLYVGYAHALATIDPGNLRLEQRVDFAGHPESFQLEKNGPRVFVNVPEAREIAVIDRTTGRQVARWKLADASANFPMALDDAHQRLFVATRRPAGLSVFDTATGKRIATLPIGGDADDLFYDPGRHRLYVICGEGTLDVILQDDPDHYRVGGRLRTAPGARTGLYVAARNALYVAVPARGGSPAEIRVYAVR